MEILLDNAFERLNTLTIANASVPVPLKKPQRTASAYETIKAYKAAERPQGKGTRWAMLDSASMIGRMAGEGDSDVDVRSRIETGLIAISAHLDEEVPQQFKQAAMGKYLNVKEPSVGKAEQNNSGSWAIQVGAFSSRERTNRAIAMSISKLPVELRYGQSMIAPLQIKEGWVFRGRINGYSKAAARRACDVLDDCVVLSPRIQ